MKLKPYGSNMTTLELNGGTVILFSYSTPVAGYHMENHEFFKTNEWYSSTTTRHINKYLDGANAAIIEQSEIDSMVS